MTDRQNSGEFSPERWSGGMDSVKVTVAERCNYVRNGEETRINA